MAETRIETKAPRRGRWLRRLGWIVGVLVVLVVALYFVATSSAFVKGVIVPRVGRAMNADISVADAQVSPFSKVVLRDVKITPKGAEPIFTATEVRLRYSLLSIIGGKIVVDELAVATPKVTLVENADGTSNLDPLLKRETPEKKSPPPTTPGSPPVVDVKSVVINNATIRKTTNLKGGGRDVLELANVNITASNIKNGQAGNLDLSAVLSLEKAAQPTSAGGTLQAALKGGFAFDLTNDLKPKSVKGDTTFTVEKATGEFVELGALTAKLDCEATPTEVKQLALRFTKAGASLGEVRVSGPFDGAKTEGKLKVEILALDRQVLNLAGAANGIDFGTTTINASSEVELARSGSLISLAGQLDIARFQITRQKQTTPTLDLRCDYNVSVDRGGESALLKTINLTATQNQRPLLQGELTSPMTIAWGKTSSAVGDAALNLTVTSLNLADWSAFAPEAAPAGKANAKLKLLSQQGGKKLIFDLEGQLEDLSARFGSNQINRANVRLLARGQAADLNQFKLDEYRLELAQQGRTALTVSGSGTFDRTTQDADLQLGVQATLARLLAMFPQPDVQVSAGAVDFKGRASTKQESKEVTGQLALTDFTGRYGEYRFANFGTGMDFDVAMKGKAVEIRKASGSVREGQTAGGKFEASGNFDLDRKTGQLALKLADFNQNGLRPFLESALGDKKLVSVALTTTASATFGADGDAAVKADLQVANLVVSDPKGGLPATPLEVKAQVDAAVAKQVAQIRQCQLTLTPTERAKNQLGLTGTVDFSKTNAITGNLKLAAESLDVTRYYDLFAGKAKPGAATPATTPTAPAAPATDPNKEPDAMHLPFRNFTFEAAIGRFYLHEVDIANLQTTARLDDNKVLVKPCQFALNGAPVNATMDLDLGVPGYKYDVAFDAKAIPLAPLVNTFVPERKGQLGGTTTASAQIKGAGTTGASLQKNLTGHFGFVSTNLNLSIANVRNPLINSIINVVIGIPDLIQNPTAAVGNLLAGLAGGGQKSGWADQLTAAPIDVILASGKASEGRVTLDQANVRSTAFEIAASGDIALAPILTNSAIKIPVNVALSRGLGDKIGLVSADTPTNVVYVSMPQFLTMKGTLGKPEKDINKVAIVALAAKVGGGLGKNIGGATGGQVGGILQGVGNLLGGTPPAAPATNAPAAAPTNKPPADSVGNLLRGLDGLLGGPKPTNPPAKPR